MEDINELYHKLILDLGDINDQKIAEAHRFIYSRALILVNPDRNDDWISELLKGMYIKPKSVDLQKGIGYKKTSASNFRSIKFEYDNNTDRLILIDKIAYYWAVIMKSFENVIIKINKQNLNVPIIIEYDQKIIFPYQPQSEEYIGFYPRSKADFADRFGIVHLETIKDIESTNPAGKFILKAFYKTYVTKIGGTFTSDDRITYLRTHENEAGLHEFYDEPTLSEDEKKRVILTQIILHESDAKKEYVLGVISTVNRVSKFAFSGACVFLKKSYFEKHFKNGEKIDNPELKSMAKGDKEIPAIISYYLWGQRISTNFTEFTRDSLELPFADQARTVTELAGYYSCYVLISDHDNNLTLNKTNVEIKSNGLIIFDKSDDTQNGYVRHVKINPVKTSLILFLGIDENKLYNQQYITLEEYHNLGNSYLTGTYSKGGDVPDAGKILFVKDSFLKESDIGKSSDLTFGEADEAVTNFFYRKNNYLKGHNLMRKNRGYLLPSYLPNKLSLFTTINENTEDSLENLFEDTHLLHMPLEITGNSFRLRKNYNTVLEGRPELNDFKFILKSNNSFQNEIIYISLPSPLTSVEFEFATGVMTFFRNNGIAESRKVFITNRVNSDFYSKTWHEAINTSQTQEKAAYKFLYLNSPMTRVRSLTAIKGDIPVYNKVSLNHDVLKAIVEYFSVDPIGNIPSENTKAEKEIIRLLKSAQSKQYLVKSFISNQETEELTNLLRPLLLSKNMNIQKEARMLTGLPVFLSPLEPEF